MPAHRAPASDCKHSDKKPCKKGFTRLIVNRLDSNMLKIGCPHQNAGLLCFFEKNFTDGCMFLERGWAFVDGLPPLAFEWEEDAASEAFARVGSRSDSAEKILP